MAAAVAARKAGNEGRARVCARRAAGIAARFYLIRRQISVETKTAYDLLGIMENMSDLSPEQRESARRLRLRVDNQFELPPEIDLIREARELITSLIPPSA